jgi:hypothetical protein
MPADPVSAGRKGGQSRSAAKIEASRRNGFPSRRPPTEEDLGSGCSCVTRPVAHVVIANSHQPKDGE